MVATVDQVVWDACNECHVIMGTATSIYATFVMTAVAEEDQTRALWPSCPALGWASGVNHLTSLPNGAPLVRRLLQYWRDGVAFRSP